MQRKVSLAKLLRAMHLPNHRFPLVSAGGVDGAVNDDVAHVDSLLGVSVVHALGEAPQGCLSRSESTELLATPQAHSSTGYQEGAAVRRLRLRKEKRYGPIGDSHAARHAHVECGHHEGRGAVLGLWEGHERGAFRHRHSDLVVDVCVCVCVKLAILTSDNA